MWFEKKGEVFDGKMSRASCLFSGKYDTTVTKTVIQSFQDWGFGIK